MLFSSAFSMHSSKEHLMIDRASRYHQILQCASDIIDASVVDSTQRELLKFGINSPSARKREEQCWSPAVTLALDSFHAVKGGAVTSPYPLAAATLFMDSGIYLLDHLADNELEAAWDSPAIAMIIAPLLGNTLSFKALEHLDISPERLNKLWSFVQQRFLEIASGELNDITSTHEQLPSPEQVWQANLAKTGARRSLYVEMGAFVAGANADTLTTLREFGLAYGNARQLSSDLSDLFQGADSRDLATRKHTWPLAWYSAQLAEADQQKFIQELDLAQSSESVRQAIYQKLEDAGVILRTRLAIQSECHRALSALHQTGLPAENLEPLSELLQHVSVGELLSDATQPSAG